ncbi:hypothetical protein L0F63_001711 [Massospora cicadina]|nr:hypothetical protein L0F63_001711 [Massospora cicadina]
MSFPKAIKCSHKELLKAPPIYQHRQALGLKAAMSQAKKIQHLRNPPAGILAIQESHCPRGELKRTQMLLPSFSAWSTLCGGRVKAITITWQGNQYTLVNTYTPNIPSDCANFFEEGT